MREAGGRGEKRDGQLISCGYWLTRQTRRHPLVVEFVHSSARCSGLVSERIFVVDVSPYRRWKGKERKQPMRPAFLSLPPPLSGEALFPTLPRQSRQFSDLRQAG